MKRKTKAIKSKARKTRTPAKRLAAKKTKSKPSGVVIHPGGKSVRVSRADAEAYRLAKRTT